MKIERNNYETCFIDYLDGSLSLDEIDVLLDFLNENPDLKDELKGLEQIKIEAQKVEIPAFNHLKKTDFDHPEIFEETCIRAIENNLEPQELKLFRQQISENPDHRQVFELFQATISEPDPFIVFEKKSQLKKKPALTFSYIWYAAAVILLGLFLIFPNREIEINTPMQVAEVVKPAEPVNNETKKEVPVIKLAEKIKPKTVALAHVKIETLSPSASAIEKRISEPVEPLTAVTVRVKPVDSEYKEFALVPVINPLSIKPKGYSKYLTLQEYFAYKVDEVENKGLLGKFALNTLKRITDDKFNYTTTGTGKVDKLEYNSKLLAFTIPIEN